MFGLPADFDGSFFVGRTLELVCFSENQVNLHFSVNTMIRIESAYSYNGEEPVDVPVRQSNLMELLGSSVLAATGDQSGTLSLAFDHGQTLKVYDTTRQYESYIISYEGKDIVV